MFRFTSRRRLSRRPAAGRGRSLCVLEALEERILLAAAVDVGDYFWANGQQVPLLRVQDTASTPATSSTSTQRFVGPRFGWTEIAATSKLSATTFQLAGSDTQLRLTEEVYVGLESADAATVFSAQNGFAGFAPVPGTTNQYVLTISAGAAASLVAANVLNGTAGVAFAHPNFVIEGWTASNDPVFGSQWNLLNSGQTGGAADADIDAPEAWAITTGSPEIVVAVLDVGFQLDHPDLASNYFVNTGEIAGNGIDDDGNGWIDDVHGLDLSNDNASTSAIEYDTDPSPANEYDNHGTAVAGVIAAVGDNGIGVTGVAPGVKILPIKIGISTAGGGFSTTVSALTAAVYYAAGRTANGAGTWRGADVANHSYGIGTPITALTQAFDWAATHGRGELGQANFVSTGNNGSSSLSYPASLASTIAVGATDNRDARASYSQYGTGLDFVAPGGGGSSSGWIWTTDRTGDDGYLPGDYIGITGTSFSSPTAAGIAALMLSVDPTLTATQIRDVMRNTADRNKVADVSFDSTHWNSEYGYGWLNAASAVKAVVNSGSGHVGGSGSSFDDVIGRQDNTGLWWVAISNGSRFTVQPWAAWSTGTQWVDFVSGDFNGDGRQDVAARDAGTGKIWVGISTGGGLVTQQWGTWSATSTLSKALVGDFNGDGRSDLAVRVENAGDGRWYVAESTGSSFTTTVWGGWTTIKTWGQVQTGDFNGDGRTDLAGRIQNSGDGRWGVMLSTGTRFASATWGQWSTAVKWDVYTGDVNGDGRTDLITRTGNGGDGRWFIATSTGTSFQNGTWGSVAADLALARTFVGDFTGDGLDDLALRSESDGRWVVLRSTPTEGVAEDWGQWSTAPWSNLVVGDFDGDGLPDVAGRNFSTGVWQVARSTGSKFITSVWGSGSSGVWSFAAAADLN